MGSTRTSFKMKLLLVVFLLLSVYTKSIAQSVSMSVTNCAVTASNQFQFDVMVTNLTASDLRFNSTVIRVKHGTSILPTGTNTETWGYVGGSDFPLSFPAVFPQLGGTNGGGGGTFTWNSTTKEFSISTSTGVYNNLSCTAPLIGPGQTKKLGRFVINNSQNFVADQSVGLIWSGTTSAVVLYNSPCVASTTAYASSGVRTLVAPCNLSTPPACQNTASSQTISACDSYTWTAGTGATYTATGTYTSVTPITGGCTDTKTLVLTINNSTSSSQSATACDTYTWSVNGTTYTASGTYTFVGTNAAGCTDTKTLVLTINNSTSSSQTATACDAYTWSVNGTTYTASGTYTFVGTNAAGCTDTKTLVLTINNSTSSSQSATACDTYTWSVNGTTYTASGTYTFVGTNAAGCTVVDGQY